MTDTRKDIRFNLQEMIHVMTAMVDRFRVTGESNPHNHILAPLIGELREHGSTHSRGPTLIHPPDKYPAHSTQKPDGLSYVHGEMHRAFRQSGRLIGQLVDFSNMPSAITDALETYHEQTEKLKTDVKQALETEGIEAFGENKKYPDFSAFNDEEDMFKLDEALGIFRREVSRLPEFQLTSGQTYENADDGHRMPDPRYEAIASDLVTMWALGVSGHSQIDGSKTLYATNNFVTDPSVLGQLQQAAMAALRLRKYPEVRQIFDTIFHDQNSWLREGILKAVAARTHELQVFSLYTNIMHTHGREYPFAASIKSFLQETMKLAPYPDQLNTSTDLAVVMAGLAENIYLKPLEPDLSRLAEDLHSGKAWAGKKVAPEFSRRLEACLEQARSIAQNRNEALLISAMDLIESSPMLSASPPSRPLPARQHS